MTAPAPRGGALAMSPAVAAEIADEHVAWLRDRGLGPEPAWGPGLALADVRAAIVLWLLGRHRARRGRPPMKWAE